MLPLSALADNKSMRHFYCILLFFAIVLLNGCSETQGPGQAPPAISYEVYTTTGGESNFPEDGLGAINNGLAGLIKRLTDSSEVHIAIFDWTAPDLQLLLADELKSHPGAHAAIIIDPKNYSDQRNPLRLQSRKRLQRLSRETGNRLELINEANPGAGILRTAEFSPRRRMHNKFFLFRHLQSRKSDLGTYSVAVSSANLTRNETGESNEMVVIHGDSGLYNRFLAYWQAMSVSDSGYSFGTTHTYSDLHDHKAWFFPKSIEGDEVGMILEALEDGIEQTRQPARIRIAMSIWHRCRKELAHRLVRMQQKHELDVRILLKEDLDIALEVKLILDSLPRGTVRYLPSRNPELQYGLHSKLMLVEGPMALIPDGEPAREYLTFTGSHNWNYDAHRFNSETWLRIADQQVHAQLDAHWNELWKKGVDTTTMFDGIPYDSTGCR